MAPYEVWGTGEDIRDFLYIEDLVRGSLLMVQHGVTNDPVNIGFGSGIRVRDLVNLILLVTDYEDADVRFNVDRPSTIPVRLVNTDKALKLLDFRPRVSIEDGLRRTARWYSETFP